MPGRSDVLLLMMAYRQSFRASELITLRWDQIDLKTAWLVQSDGRKITEIVRRDPARRPTERNCLNRPDSRQWFVLRCPSTRTEPHECGNFQRLWRETRKGQIGCWTGLDLMGWTAPRSITASMGHDGSFDHRPQNEEGPKMGVTIVGIDLAKNVFRLHGCDEQGRAVLRKQLTRGNC
jgi:hypothetical protein